MIVEGKLWEVELETLTGNREKILGFGISKIMETPEPVGLKGVRSLFKHIPAEIFEDWPKKSIDLLIGINKLGLHPSGGQGQNTVVDLKMYHSKFGRGWLLGGSSPLIDCQEGDKVLSPAAISIVQIVHIKVCPTVEVSDYEIGTHSMTATIDELTFLESFSC